MSTFQNNTTMTMARRGIPACLLLGMATLLLLSGCAALSTPPVVPSQNIYMLDQQPILPASQVRHDLVLAVSAMQTRPGLDTPQMAYSQRKHELNYFVTSRWADMPARMLEPLVIQALEQTDGFRAVVLTPGAVPADLRLETELTLLHQDFTTHPSRVQLTLRVRLIDVRNKRVLAIRQFDDSEKADSDDAYGGVNAANRIVPRILKQLADFCVSEGALR
jgi:cholesterol transport system auxiliary component